MKPSETIIALRKLWKQILNKQMPEVEEFESEDAFVFYHLDRIYEESNASR